MDDVAATSLGEIDLDVLEQAVRGPNQAFARRYPGEVAARQPVHTVYGGAQLFRADAARKLGAVALRALEEYAPDAATLGRALGIEGHPALDTLYARMAAKLAHEAVEDFRIDFEDGYGNRQDDEEDHHAVVVGEELALVEAMKELAGKGDLRFTPCNLLQTMAASGKKFYPN